MTRTLRALAMSALLVGACTADKPADPPARSEAVKPKAAETPAAKPPAEPVPDNRTAAQFAAEWARLRQVPVEQQGTAGKTMRDGWHNRIYTWTGYAVPGLCMKGGQSCAMHVFERRTTPPEARLDGYFPQVVFTQAGYAALETACKGKTGCVVTFRATLSETETDPAEPLRLHFTAAEFVAGRDPTPEEQWFGRRAGAKVPEKVPNAKVRTGTPVPSTIKALRQTF